MVGIPGLREAPVCGESQDDRCRPGKGRQTSTCMGKAGRPKSRSSPSGDSSHTWGREHGAGGDGVGDGQTPTCVGKTRIAGSRSGSRRTDPHARGEDGGQVLLAPIVDDRPPHARGRFPWAVRRAQPRNDAPPHAWRKPEVQKLVVNDGGRALTRVRKTRARVGPTARRQTGPHARGKDPSRPACLKIGGLYFTGACSGSPIA